MDCNFYFNISIIIMSLSFHVIFHVIFMLLFSYLSAKGITFEMALSTYTYY